jgi:hypothetical protein
VEALELSAGCWALSAAREGSAEMAVRSIASEVTRIGEEFLIC